MRKGFISAAFDFQRPFKYFGNWNHHYRLEVCWKDTLETFGFTLHSYRKKSFGRKKKEKKKGTLLSCWESLYLFFPWLGLLLEKHCNGYLDSNVISSRKWILTFLVKVLLFFLLPPSDDITIEGSLAQNSWTPKGLWGGLSFNWAHSARENMELVLG